MDSSSIFSLERWDLAPGEAISQSPPSGGLQGERTLLCPAPTLDTDEYIAHNAISEGYLSVDSMAEFGLAPGEAISQSPPMGALQSPRTLRCPPPTLDTDEYIVHNILSEDCSSVDSMAEFGLALGEVRSQSPHAIFHGSQVLQCPPPSLDTQEFEKDFDFVDPWIVEDSQAPGEIRSLGTLDTLNAPNQFCPPSLDNQKFQNNRFFPGDVVEDSLPPWDSVFNGARSGSHVDQSDTSKRESLPSSVDVPGRTSDDRELKAVRESNSAPANCIVEAGVNSTVGSKLVVPLSSSAGKRSSSPTLAQGDGGNSKKQHAEVSEAEFSGEFNFLLPVPSSGRPNCVDSHVKVQRSSTNESLREQDLAVAKRENLGPIFVPLPNQMLPAIVSPTTSDTKATANKLENDICNTSIVREFTSANIVNATVSEARSPWKTNGNGTGLGSPINDSADHCRNSIPEGVSVKSQVFLPLANEGVSTNSGRHSAKPGILSDSNEGNRINVTDVHADTIGEKMGCGSGAKEKVQTCLAFQRVTFRKSGQQGDGWGTDGWRCPRTGKKVRPTSRQVSLDRWMP